MAFPAELRESKFFFYPTVKHEFSRKFCRWEEHVKFSLNSFFAFNTEDIPNAPEMRKLSSLYTPASGLIFARILQKFGYQPNCQVHFYDYSIYAMETIKRIINEWDGRDYPAFLKKQWKHAT